MVCRSTRKLAGDTHHHVGIPTTVSGIPPIRSGLWFTAGAGSGRKFTARAASTPGVTTPVSAAAGEEFGTHTGVNDPSLQLRKNHAPVVGSCCTGGTHAPGAPGLLVSGSYVQVTPPV